MAQIVRVGNFYIALLGNYHMATTAMLVDFFSKFDKVKILEQNEDFLIINKPSGLLVHPDKYSNEQTLIDVLLKIYPEINGVGQPGRSRSEEHTSELQSH